MADDNFQHAPPGLRKSGTGPAAKLPAGVEEPGLRTGSGSGPRAYIAYRGPAEPRSGVGMVGLCLLLLGLQTMASAGSVGGFVAGLLFGLAGAVIGGVWLRLWWLWRTAFGAGFRWRWRG